MEPLPSLFDLPAGSFADALVVVATHMAGLLHPFGVQSWDLTLHGEGFDALSSDPFSFAGEFPFEGLTTVRGNLLEPAGFGGSSRPAVAVLFSARRVADKPKPAAARDKQMA